MTNSTFPLAPQGTRRPLGDRLIGAFEIATKGTGRKFDNSFGYLARTILGELHAVRVLRSNAGYYIGTASGNGSPISRESQEYYPTEVDAINAILDNSWTQRLEP
jgi:hypothetical protein